MDICVCVCVCVYACLCVWLCLYVSVYVLCVWLCKRARYYKQDMVSFEMLFCTCLSNICFSYVNAPRFVSSYCIHSGCLSNICLSAQKMPATLEVSYTLQIDDAPAWKIPSSALVLVGEEQYVKIKAYDVGFIRMLCHGCVDLPEKTRFALSETDGWKVLRDLRNKAAFTQPCADEPQENNSLVALFGCEPSPQPKKAKVRISADKVGDMRNNPTTFEFIVPVDGCEMGIKAVTPAHPCDELVLKLDPDGIEHVCNFIKSNGLDQEMLLRRRNYRDEGHAGLWRNGRNSGLVRKGDSASDGLKKWLTVVPKKRVHDLDQAEESGGDDAPTEAHAALADEVETPDSL